MTTTKFAEESPVIKFDCSSFCYRRIEAGVKGIVEAKVDHTKDEKISERYRCDK